MDSQNMNGTPIYVPQNEEMSVGEWIGTLILTCIPVVNVIMLIVWACGSKESSKARKNWAIAQLVITAVLIVLAILFGSMFVAALASMF